MKSSIIILLVAVTFPLFAQDEQQVKKADKGSFVPEVNFSPFSTTPIRISYLRVRYFLKDKVALRAGFNFVSKYEEPSGLEAQKSRELSFRPGIEKHFSGSDRVSPYIGFEIEITDKSSVYKNDNPAASISDIDQVWLNGTERGFTRLGINVIAGMDFYLASKFYMGVEFGFSYQTQTFKKITYTTTFNLPPVESTTSRTLSPVVNSFIRLGYVIN